MGAPAPLRCRAPGRMVGRGPGRSIGSVPVALDAVAADASGCTRCPLAAGRTQVVFGCGDPAADLLFVGEGPGAEEDAQGLPFVGRSGRLLDRLMAEEMGLTRDDVYITNTVMCRPPGNRDPRPDEVAACAGWLSQKLDVIAPRVVVTLGNAATRSLLGTREGITRLRGRTYPWRGATLVPTFHPAAVLRGGADPMAKVRADLVRAKLALRATGDAG
jgi:uracil-DNA glycosylase